MRLALSFRRSTTLEPTCLLQVSTSIAQYPEYRYALWSHLHSVKLFHWDSDIRELSARTLGRFAVLDPKHAIDTTLPDLLERTTSAQLFERHGSVLAIAEIVLSLAVGVPSTAASESVASTGHSGSFTPTPLPEDTLTAIRNIVPRAEKARAYRGRGGELVRAAVCRLIECMCLAGHPLSRRAALRLLDTLEECLKHPYDSIQRAASAALRYEPMHSPAAHVCMRLLNSRPPPSVFTAC